MVIKLLILMMMALQTSKTVLPITAVDSATIIPLFFAAAVS